MGKAKTTAPAIPQSREEVQAWIADLGKSQREHARLATEMNDKLAPITAEYAPQIEARKVEQSRLLEGIASWCEANKTGLTKESKTVNLITGEVSWRKNPPSVAFKRGIKAEAIIAHIKQLKFGKLFVRTKEEVDKEAILAADQKIKDKLVAAGTIKIVDDSETFSVTPFEADAGTP